MSSCLISIENFLSVGREKSGRPEGFPLEVVVRVF
jgi:hypothetical protein